MRLYKIPFLYFVSILLIFFYSCSLKNSKMEEELNEELPDLRKDIHSYAEPEVAVVTHLDWEAEVDFDNKIIKGLAKLTIKTGEGAEKLVLDTKNLVIEEVTIGTKGDTTSFKKLENDIHLGEALEINILPETKQVNIRYRTSKDAEALQWLDPVQTAGGKDPFLFTQSQAILARTWIPIQDSPGIRFTYNARVKVPQNLLALMSAENPVKKNANGVYDFQMKQPIPAYLMALAVGDIEFQSTGNRTGVYAEPSMLPKAVFEFEEMEMMLETAEKLYGPYQWERYDLIVLPPSFPFGGMENPRLTFATPTILAGDKSLTSLVAHELAHSWSGNLVTNATWNDFWLNEGFTVYFERRIMEALQGPSYAEMLASLGYQDLLHTIDDFLNNGSPEDTKLKLNLAGRNPDDGVSEIAYEKGYFFLRILEEKVGRNKFDAFLKNYFKENSFKTMTTGDFISYLKVNLFDKNNITFDYAYIDSWINGVGLPDGIKEIKSERFVQVENELNKFFSGAKPSELATLEWSSHEWLHFIRHLPKEITKKELQEIDDAFHFTNSGNSEILTAWFLHVIAHQYEKGYDSLNNFLMNVGRRKFLVPLYKEMAKTENGKTMALEIYKNARANYHFVSVNTLDQILNFK
jgi:leukotriene-A4 hydrolase